MVGNASKTGLLFYIPRMIEGREEEITINIDIGNCCRKMKKFNIMIWTICMPWRDRVGSRVNNRMSVMRIKDKVSPMCTHGRQGQRLELCMRLKDTLLGTWRVREGMMGACILIPVVGAGEQMGC